MNPCTNPPTEAPDVSCRHCGWQGAAEDVPFGTDPWTTDGGALCYCPKCGMVDDLTYKEEN